MTPDPETVDRLARIETKLDLVFARQDERLSDLEYRLTTTEDKISDHLSEAAGLQRGTQWVFVLTLGAVASAITLIINEIFRRLTS